VSPPQTTGRGPLLVVDTPSMLYRAFFALPKTITGIDDRPVNALLGTANLVLREVEEHAPRAVVLCFGAEAAEYRKELLPSYHGDRDEMPELLVWQWEQAPRFFGAFGWTIEQHPTLEADDLLGTLAKKEAEAGGEALILTGDRDMFQCATDEVSVLYVSTKIKGGAERMGPKEVKARYGIPPELVPDFIALRGDPSDGIPGARGVGEKGASELLREHGSLEALLDAAVRITKPKLRTTLIDSREQLLGFKDIATLRDSGSELPGDAPLDNEAAADAALEYGMNRLSERLAAWGSGSAGG
jgi:5'-3' exonuclease